MKEMLDSATFSDVEFAVGDELIPAHKVILAKQLPYFKTLFASGMKESATNRIEIKDADAPTFKGFLCYVYSEKLPHNFVETAEIYLPLAEKYDVPPLKEECISALRRRLHKDNVIETLQLADLYRSPALKFDCLHLIKKYGSELDREALAKVRPELMLEALTFSEVKHE